MAAAETAISTAGSTATGVIGALARSPWFWAGAGVLTAAILIDANDPGFNEILTLAVAGGAAVLIVYLYKK